MADWFIIFGAKVNRDGSPSGALVRRVESAVAASHKSSAPMFLPSGGRGKSGYIEAGIMRRMLLERGVPDPVIVCEGASRDTLQSVLACFRILRERPDVDQVFLCSDRYHQPRCRVLFAVLGMHTISAPIASAARTSKLSRYSYMVLREVVAVPVDVALMVLLRMFRRV